MRFLFILILSFNLQADGPFSITKDDLKNLDKARNFLKARSQLSKKLKNIDIKRIDPQAFFDNVILNPKATQKIGRNMFGDSLVWKYSDRGVCGIWYANGSFKKWAQNSMASFSCPDSIKAGKYLYSAKGKSVRCGFFTPGGFLISGEDLKECIISAPLNPPASHPRSSKITLLQTKLRDKKGRCGFFKKRTRISSMYKHNRLHQKFVELDPLHCK